MNPMAVILTLVLTGAPSLKMEPAAVESQWNDPRTPSCRMYEARYQQMTADQQEIDFLLERLRRKRHLSEREKLEFQEALRRQGRLAEESARQKITFTARFPRPAQVNTDWVTNRAYRLVVKSPGLDWAGTDASEPYDVKVETDANEIKFRHEIHLADYCRKAREINVRLEQM